MGAFVGAEHFFNKPLIEVAKQLHYDEDNLLILQGKEQELKERYPNIYKNILSCRHNADKRTPMEYAQDLVASWLVEDSFFKVLNHGALRVDLGGTDSQRKVLSKSKVKTNSDFFVHYHDKSLKIELMNDYTGFWDKYHKLHLRDDKFVRMKNGGCLLLAVSTVNKNHALFDFNKGFNAKYIPSHRQYGGKPAYELEISSDIMRPATSQNIICSVKEAFA